MSDSMLAEALGGILRDQCTPAIVRAADQGSTPVALWRSIEEAGFLELLAPESAGGAGLEWNGLFPILFDIGRYAVPLPLGETLLARLLCGDALPSRSARITIATRLQDEGGLVCPATPFGTIADFVIARHAGQLCLLDAKAAQRMATGVHGSLDATLSWSPGGIVAHLPRSRVTLRAFAAALYAAQLAGAMTRVFEMTLQYCNDRVQFGKSLGKFQAVQHQLSLLAEEVAAATMSAEAAFANDGPELLPAAIAKSRTSEAAGFVAATAHALHGAIGFTEEFDLQLYTRRLHQWRMTHGAEAHWNRVIGEAVLVDASSVVDFVVGLQDAVAPPLAEVEG